MEFCFCVSTAEGIRQEFDEMCDSTISPPGYLFNPSSNLVASSTGSFPEMTDFAGDLNFEIILSENDSVKKQWLFSEKLNKVFIDIDKHIGIQFRWRETNYECPSPKFIRALPVYTQHDWLLKPVLRCTVHELNDKKRGPEQPWTGHVLRCGSADTEYHVDLESFRRSCRAPVSLKSPDDVVILYFQFVCKTSCYRGQQRRPVVVIFTLEDTNGNVLGRRCLPFKVCSCLKRDLNREEKGQRKRKNRSVVFDMSEYLGMSQVRVPPSPLPGTIRINSNERTTPCTFRLQRLKREYLEFALTNIHDTILGQYMRHDADGSEALIAELDKFLSKFYNPNSNSSSEGP